MSPQLILKRATASRPSGEWNEDDFDVVADGVVVGRIFKAKCGAWRNAVDVDPSLLGNTIRAGARYRVDEARRRGRPAGSRSQGPTRIDDASSGYTRRSTTS
jgi:hypothetical protein